MSGRIIERLADELADYTPVPADRWLAVIERTMGGAAPDAFTIREASLLATAADAMAELLTRQGDVGDADELRRLAGVLER